MNPDYKTLTLPQLLVAICKKTRQEYTTTDLHNIVMGRGHRCQPWDVRDALIDLWKSGDIKQVIKPRETVIWKIDAKKHPTPTGTEQKTMF